ncbi:RelA/SpoT domain-containing protein [Bosea sp. BIWAKO-01]|uniref:RelA/SpoT domain-containing protein n=1 Tax=Bosea sp. BIWAKO-01 TaxID=506668 RepID=UPI00085355E4|nr:RelA/SpoT domain-containing protein [Bosea sp. BIWAKO-01]GAU84746.1 RelA/SpoT domain protein [Bosea sp. BIWAKO-01]
MVAYPHFLYSKKDVGRAGRRLAGDLVWNAQTQDEIRYAFAVANSWRDSHAAPMRRIHAELIAKVRKLGLKQTSGISAARLKRMTSIRKKLRKIRVGLESIQDLGGCRAILPRMEDLQRLVDAYGDSCRHTIFDQDNYIAEPKPGGYRSHHLKLKFAGTGEAEHFSGRRIEVQVRTQLQHTWATAVEAVGLIRGEDLKGGAGNGDWLRLFELVSSEFAEHEKCAPVPGAPVGRERRQEIRDLDRRLGAAATLDNLSQAFRAAERHVFDRDTKYFLIRYDTATNEVSVTAYREPMKGIESYEREEIETIIDPERPSFDTVLVEVDKVKNLKEAYPNYFGDVHLFRRQLRRISKARDSDEFQLMPQEIVPPKPREAPDLSWFTRDRFLRR